MGTIAARKTSTILRNVKCILAIDMTSAPQAVHLRGPEKLAKGTAKAYRMIMKILPPVVNDRSTYVNIAKLVEILRELRTVESI